MTLSMLGNSIVTSQFFYFDKIDSFKQQYKPNPHLNCSLLCVSCQKKLDLGLYGWG